MINAILVAVANVIISMAKVEDVICFTLCVGQNNGESSLIFSERNIIQ